MSSFHQKIKQRGLILTIETQFNRFVPSWLFRFSIGDVLDLDLDQMRFFDGSDPGDDLRFTCVEDEAKRTALRTFTWNSVPLETTRTDIGYAVTRRDEENFVGGVWAAKDNFLEPNLGFQVDLSNNQAWLYCAYVDERARGSGVYKRLMGFVADDLQQRQIDTLLVVIQPWNKPSMRVHGRFMRAKVGRIVVVRLLRCSFIFTTGSIDKSGTVTTNQSEAPIRTEVVL